MYTHIYMYMCPVMAHVLDRSETLHAILFAGGSEGKVTGTPPRVDDTARIRPIISDKAMTNRCNTFVDQDTLLIAGVMISMMF